MLRSNKVILVSHCVLNQNTVVHPLARSEGAFKTIIDILMEYNYGIIQLSCPEIMMYGMSRIPMTKSEYDTPDYKALCKTLAERDYELIERLIEGNITISGIIGIDQSPSCSQFDEVGHFMMALKQIKALENLPQIDVPESYIIGSQDADAFHEHLKTWLSQL